MPLATNNLKGPAFPVQHTHRQWILLPLLLLIAGILLLISQRQNIHDWARLRDYTPPPTVQAIAQDDAMTASARKVFYVNHPQIQGKTAFSPLCPSGTEQTVVLGCYHGDQSGIFVLQVTDSRLNGIEQVTSAHELLHAEYDRLSPHLRQQVNGWLMEYYQHDLHDQTTLAQIAAYKKNEPADVMNEMHSLFGSQQANLSPQLEQYYKRYFTHRSDIVGYYTAYEAEFTNRQTTIKADDVQLTSWKQQITDDESNLKQAFGALQLQQQRLSQLRGSSAAAYNQAVPAYNMAVDTYNAQLDGYHTLLQKYNQLVAARNALVLETQQLTHEISSQVSPLG